MKHILIFLTSLGFIVLVLAIALMGCSPCGLRAMGEMEEGKVKQSSANAPNYAQFDLGGGDKVKAFTDPGTGNVIYIYTNKWLEQGGIAIAPRKF